MAIALLRPWMVGLLSSSKRNVRAAASVSPSWVRAVCDMVSRMVLTPLSLFCRRPTLLLELPRVRLFDQRHRRLVFLLVRIDGFDVERGAGCGERFLDDFFIREYVEVLGHFPQLPQIGGGRALQLGELLLGHVGEQVLHLRRLAECRLVRHVEVRRALFLGLPGCCRTRRHRECHQCQSKEDTPLRFHIESPDCYFVMSLISGASKVSFSAGPAPPVANSHVPASRSGVSVVKRTDAGLAVPEY